MSLNKSQRIEWAPSFLTLLFWCFFYYWEFWLNKEHKTQERRTKEAGIVSASLQAKG